MLNFRTGVFACWYQCVLLRIHTLMNGCASCLTLIVLPSSVQLLSSKRFDCAQAQDWCTKFLEKNSKGKKEKLWAVGKSKVFLKTELVRD